MDLDLFAEYFTTHLPITALVFDNRCLGASDGTPRFELVPCLQMSDIQDAITYAQSLDEVNSEKIAIWGSSYSGANVLQVAAFDRRIKAVLAQNPLISGWDNFRRLVSSGDIPQLNQMFAAGITRQTIILTQIALQECEGNLLA
jgi:cephalosporin-C deacetylase-like acetyl esterase